jgi:hypothetical protein
MLPIKSATVRFAEIWVEWHADIAIEALRMAR